MTRYDAIFVGSSPNALAGAARLGQKGKRVLVVEPRAAAGGPVATEEFAKGFLGDTGLASAPVDSEVEAGLGLTFERAPRETVTVVGEGRAETVRSPALPAAVGDAVALLRAISKVDAPNMPVPAAEGGRALSELGGRLLGLGERGMHEVLRLLFMPVRDLGVELGLSPAEQAALAAAAVRAMSEGPFAPGTVFNYLAREAAGDGLFAPWTKGGPGAVSAALAAKAREAGVEIRTGVRDVRVDVEAGVATGVLAGGERIEAGAVVSDLDVRATFTRLVAPYELSPEANRAIRGLRYRGTVARVHLALREMPRFEGVSDESLRGTLLFAADVAAIERAWDAAKRGRAPEKPCFEVTIPSLVDPGLAPAGHHVVSAWAPQIPTNGADRGSLADALIGALSQVAPGIGDLVLHRHVLLPEDLGERFGLSEGQLYGGEVNLAQFFFLRGVPGCTGFETPIENLHLCGSAAHPGDFSGRSGWALAEQLL
ncbi:MAG: NAD(P)/FAD-dependent oxidoreductase [Polyangiaceae bacterium]